MESKQHFHQLFHYIITFSHCTSLQKQQTRYLFLVFSSQATASSGMSISVLKLANTGKKRKKYQPSATQNIKQRQQLSSLVLPCN